MSQVYEIGRLFRAVAGETRLHNQGNVGGRGGSGVPRVASFAGDEDSDADPETIADIQGRGMTRVRVKCAICEATTEIEHPEGEFPPECWVCAVCGSKNSTAATRVNEPEPQDSPFATKEAQAAGARFDARESLRQAFGVTRSSTKAEYAAARLKFIRAECHIANADLVRHTGLSSEDQAALKRFRSTPGLRAAWSITQWSTPAEIKTIEQKFLRAMRTVQAKS